MGNAVNDDKEYLQTVVGLNRTMGELHAKVRELKTASDHNRRMIWSIAIPLLLDLVLSVALGIVAVEAFAATSAAAEVKRSARITCLATNETHKVDLALWTYVLRTASQAEPPLTAQQKRQIKDFQSYVNREFAQQDCD